MDRTEKCADGADTPHGAIRKSTEQNCTLKIDATQVAGPMPADVLCGMLPRRSACVSVPLCPGGVVSRATRRLLRDRAALVVIEGDGPAVTAARVSDFPADSVKWALQDAKVAVIWAAGWKVDGDFAGPVRRALEENGRAVLVLTRNERLLEWLEVVARYLPSERILAIAAREEAGNV